MAGGLRQGTTGHSVWKLVGSRNRPGFWQVSSDRIWMQSALGTVVDLEITGMVLLGNFSSLPILGLHM